jgi:hypothetical protein
MSAGAFGSLHDINSLAGIIKRADRDRLRSRNERACLPIPSALLCDRAARHAGLKAGHSSEDSK